MVKNRATFLAPYARIIHFAENASKMAEVFFTESIECFIEDQAFSPSHDLPPPPVSKLDWRHTGRMRKRDSLLTGERGYGVGEEPNHKTARKPGLLLIINTLRFFT